MNSHVYFDGSCRPATGGMRATFTDVRGCDGGHTSRSSSRGVLPIIGRASLSSGLSEHALLLLSKYTSLVKVVNLATSIRC